MALEHAEIEVWVVVDANGDYAAGRDEEDALQKFEDEVGDKQARRLVKMSLKVPLPAVLEVSAEIEVSEEEAAELKVA